MDFARISPRLDAEAGATWHVDFEGESLYQDGEPIEIDFVGLESKTAKRAAAELARKIDKKNGGNKRSLRNMTVEQIMAAGQDSEEAQAEFYAALTTGWRNVTYIPDEHLDDPEYRAEALAYSEANAVKLFRTRPWLIPGADRFLGDKSNFDRTRKAS